MMLLIDYNSIHLVEYIDRASNRSEISARLIVKVSDWSIDYKRLF